MEPRIQYVRTADGVSIACTKMGQGMAHVRPPPALPWSHIQVEWEIPEWRAWEERLLAKTAIVRYDGRGSGLSDRHVIDFSLDSLLLDLEAVVDGLGLERLALFGCFFAGPVAIAYAARHPERVSHLILWCSFANAAEIRQADARTQALTKMMEFDWELFTETLAHTLFGWSAGDPAHRVATYMREALTQEAAMQGWEQLNELDVTGLLSQVQAPTLVAHRRDFPIVPLDIARRLASSIPNARLAVLEGASLAPYIGGTSMTTDMMLEFLGIPKEREPHEAHGHEHATTAAGAFRTILFSDIENSTALTRRLGDARGRELLRMHERTVREALHAYGGSEVKTLGDGFMASFGSATRAVECAIAIQRAIAQHNETAAEPVRVCVGLNAGEPIAEEDDLFGTSVNLAARIAAKASGGEILAPDVVRHLVAGKGFLFADRGDAVLRGFEDPVRLFEVGWRAEA